MKYLLAMLALALATTCAATDVRPLDASQVSALLAAPAKGERLIALWSLDCSYCEANLQALSRLHKAHPDRIELVIVATDPIAARDSIAQRLHRAGMDGFQARAYAEDVPDHLNYLLDPTWGGEMPHVLVVRSDGSRRGISGLLNATVLQQLEP
ncbi:hypothetical protein DVT68_11840 [Dyella solisilvae]|uniref:TlpA family protein disulfide reductase n=1 Tax=Dyella solisilvae TaxID=1920168 RepID=A0A370K950_9GAMM|nr:hypothetical protein [Dyella solisilvae]RDI99159.1 hypothetical protein DVT68_11840 [Dyella solisilvae]